MLIFNLFHYQICLIYSLVSLFQIKKKSLEKAKEEENMSKEFAAMEEAAMKAYQEDMKRLGIKPGSSYSCQKIKDGIERILNRKGFFS